MQNIENLDVFEISITQNLLKCPKDPFVRSALIYRILHECFSCCRYRVSYMSAHAFFDLLSELGKRDKMRGLPSILCLFRNELI